jgi:hypothetical protein
MLADLGEVGVEALSPARRRGIASLGIEPLCRLVPGPAEILESLQYQT